jgi:hypothetical protein
MRSKVNEVLHFFEKPQINYLFELKIQYIALHMFKIKTIILCGPHQNSKRKRTCFICEKEVRLLNQKYTGSTCWFYRSYRAIYGHSCTALLMRSSNWRGKQVKQVESRKTGPITPSFFCGFTKQPGKEDDYSYSRTVRTPVPIAQRKGFARWFEEEKRTSGPSYC